MISVVILVRNSEKTLYSVLAALKQFDEIIIYDTGSKDNSLEIASSFSNVQIIKGLLQGFGPTRNVAAKAAKHEWILSIDSDEVLSKEALEELHQLKLEKKCVYSFPFHNYYNGKFIKWCGWYPEEHIRLYHKATTQFSEAMVHEGVMSKGLKVIKLHFPVLHFSYHCVDDFLSKMQSYSELFALQNKGKKKSSLSIALLHSATAFFKSYFIKRGFLGGYEGLLISFYNSHTAFYKYIKLYELNKHL